MRTVNAIALPRSARFIRRGVLSGCLVTACGPVIEPADASTEGGFDTASAGSTVGTGGTSGSPDSGASTSALPGDTGATTSDTNDATDSTSASGSDSSGAEATGIDFIVSADGGGISIKCSVWDQDCQTGEKCMPWAEDGGDAWNATKCAPLDPNPAQPGDPCTVDGTHVSGVDDCDVASMCWDVDPETNEGTCVAFCTGSEDNPVCENPDTACFMAYDGVLNLCLPACDPLVQDCLEGQACYGVSDAFICLSDASGEMGAYGDPCTSIDGCDPGLECLNGEGVPGCSEACCSPHCDLSDPNASGECPGAAGGQACVRWFEEGEAPPGYVNVGVCFIPP